MGQSRRVVPRRARGRFARADASLLYVEDEPRRPDDHLVARRETGALDPAPVDLHAVGRAEVDDLPVPRRPPSQLRVAARDVRVPENAVALPGAPEDRDRAIQDVAAIVEGHDRTRVHQASARLTAALLTPPLLWLLALTRGRLDEPGLNPELAEPQAVVVLERDLGPREQRIVAPARVLEEVPRELLGERGL